MPMPGKASQEYNQVGSYSVDGQLDYGSYIAKVFNTDSHHCVINAIAVLGISSVTLHSSLANCLVALFTYMLVIGSLLLLASLPATFRGDP